MILPTTPSTSKKRRRNVNPSPELAPDPSPGSTKAVPQKRRSMGEHLHDITDWERASRVKVAENSAKERTAREALKRNAAVKMEAMCINFEREENEKKRAHELQMLRARIELLKLQTAVGAATATGSSAGLGLLLDGMDVSPDLGAHLSPASQFNSASLGFTWDKSFATSDGSSLVGL